MAPAATTSNHPNGSSSTPTTNGLASNHSNNHLHHHHHHSQATLGGLAATGAAALAAQQAEALGRIFGNLKSRSVSISERGRVGEMERARLSKTELQCRNLTIGVMGLLMIFGLAKWRKAGTKQRLL